MSAPSRSAGPLASRWVYGAVCAVLVALCLWILKPFASAIVWAAILAHVTWPLNRLLRRPFGRFKSAAALLTVCAVVCVIVIPLLWLLFLLRNELLASFAPVSSALMQGLRELSEQVLRIPWIGPLLRQQFAEYAADRSALAHEAAGWLQRGMGALGTVLGQLGRGAAQLLLTLLVLFFLYRDGDAVAAQIGRIARQLFADRLARYAESAGALTR